MRTFEYRMRPTKKQEQALMSVLIASRKMYNACLEELITHYKETGKYLHIYEQDKRHGKEAHPDLPAVVVDTTLKRLHRPLQGTFKFARLVLRPSGWYVQCICETEPSPLPKKENAVGLDMGIRYLIADSDGRIVENPNHAKKSARKLAHAQRKLEKCKKGSNRRKKAKQQVSRQHERIANQRKDTLHKASRHYVDRYQTIVIEDLKVANMVRNHCLAFAIADASWGMFRQYLESKAESAGRQVVAVAPHYTSQKCSQCKEYVQKSLSVRTHVCPFCGYLADRDENAARNILRAGKPVQARMGPSSREREGPSSEGESPLPLKREAPGL